MARVLFTNPPSVENIYHATNVSIAAPSYPSLSLATLAGDLTSRHEVKIVDLDFSRDMFTTLFDEVDKFKPDIVAFSINTPAYNAARDMAINLKSRYSRIKIIAGGVHITALPEEAARDGCFDILAIGESDKTISELLSLPSQKDVAGIMYRDENGGKYTTTRKREHSPDPDTLSLPAWDLFTLDRYKNSRISSRMNPVGLIETSRGCAYQCVFCSKLTFGNRYRAKHPKRVVDEMEYMLKCGFREIHIVDDSFTQDIARAKEICGEIIRRGLKFPWSLINGIRVDMTDEEFFHIAKRSGCWQVGFGIETGDQDILNNVNKGSRLSDTERSIRLAHKIGINTFGFFIFGLPGETEESIIRTINFSKRIPLDIAKYDICIPYPGTQYYRELKSQSRILCEDWSKYNCHQIETPLFRHPNLDWNTMVAYYKRAFRSFYLRPAYILRRLARSIQAGDLLYDVIYFLRSKWW